MITWQIEKRKIEDLKGYDKNPRKFTKKGLKDLKASLENLGDANIITINADNTVLGGHARLTVMKQLGYTEVDVKVPNRQLDEQEVKEIEVPEEVETRCKPGDIWKLGNHRLMCGNSTILVKKV